MRHYFSNNGPGTSSSVPNATRQAAISLRKSTQMRQRAEEVERAETLVVATKRARRSNEECTWRKRRRTTIEKPPPMDCDDSSNFGKDCANDDASSSSENCANDDGETMEAAISERERDEEDRTETESLCDQDTDSLQVLIEQAMDELNSKLIETPALEIDKTMEEGKQTVEESSIKELRSENIDAQLEEELIGGESQRRGTSEGGQEDVDNSTTGGKRSKRLADKKKTTEREAKERVFSIEYPLTNVEKNSAARKKVDGKTIAGITMGHDDWESLERRGDVTDNVVNICSSIFQHSADKAGKSITIFNSSLLSCLSMREAVPNYKVWREDDKLAQPKVWIMPFCEETSGESHWTSLIIDFTRRAIIHLNSIDQEPNKTLYKTLWYVLIGFHTALHLEEPKSSDWTIHVPRDVPRQVTGSRGSRNCAMHQLVWFKSICDGEGQEFNDKQCTQARTNIVEFIATCDGYPDDDRVKFFDRTLQLESDHHFAARAEAIELPAINDGNSAKLKESTGFSSTLEYCSNLLE